MSLKPQDSRIIFGESRTGEILRPDDFILAKLSIFRGQFQTDIDLCAYLVFAAQLHLSNSQNLNMLGESLAETSSRIIDGVGLKKIAELLKNQIKETRLSSWTLKSELVKRIRGVKIVTSFLDYQENDKETVGTAAIRAIKNKMLPGIILTNEEHMVLGIGYSQDEEEIIVWDALSGSGDPRLRRISVRSENLEFISAVEMHQLFLDKN